MDQSPVPDLIQQVTTIIIIAPPDQLAILSVVTQIKPTHQQAELAQAQVVTPQVTQEIAKEAHQQVHQEEPQQITPIAQGQMLAQAQAQEIQAELALDPDQAQALDQEQEEETQAQANLINKQPKLINRLNK